MKLYALLALAGVEIPPWFLEALGGVGTCVAYVIGRFAKQDVSESKLAGVIKAVATMGEGVKTMGEASAARHEQIAALQRNDKSQWDAIAEVRKENNRLNGELNYLKGQIGK